MPNQYHEDVCPVCYYMIPDTCFSCGHVICSTCRYQLSECYYRCNGTDGTWVDIEEFRNEGTEPDEPMADYDLAIEDYMEAEANGRTYITATGRTLIYVDM